MNFQKIIAIHLTFYSITGAAYILNITRSFILPFAVAVLLSFLIIPVANFLEGKKIPSFLTNIFIFVLISLILTSLGMMLYGSLLSVKNQIPSYFKENKFLIDSLANYFERHFNVTILSDSEGISIREIFNLVSPKSLITAINTSFGSFIEFLSKIMLTLLFLMFIFLSRKTFVKKVMRFAEAGRTDSDTGHHIMISIAEQIQSYLWLKTLISVGTGLLFGITTFLMGIDFYLVWGFMVFLLNYIPTLGPIIATVPPVIITYLQFDSAALATAASLILVAIQMTSGMVVEPKIMGDKLNLNIITVLLSLFLWGLIWGYFGMILAVPIVVSINIILSNIPKYRRISDLLSR